MQGSKWITLSKDHMIKLCKDQDKFKTDQDGTDLQGYG